MADPAPTLATAPTPGDLAGLACPVERARLLTTLSRTCGTLPGPLAAMRRADIRRALAEGWRVVALAKEVGLSKSRISQLTKPGATAGRPEAPAVAATSAPTEVTK